MLNVNLKWPPLYMPEQTDRGEKRCQPRASQETEGKGAQRRQGCRVEAQTVKAKADAIVANSMSPKKIRSSQPST